MFKKGDRVRFTKTNPNGGEGYGKEGDIATILVPDTGYNHEYHSNQAEVDLPGCNIEPNVPWSSLEHAGPVRTVTRQEIIPGTYDGVTVGYVTDVPDCDNPDAPVVRELLVTIPPTDMDHAALTRAAAVLTALAGALRDGN